MQGGTSREILKYLADLNLVEMISQYFTTLSIKSLGQGLLISKAMYKQKKIMQKVGYYLIK